MLEYKMRKKREREAGMGRINLDLPMKDLKELKLLAVRWKCEGIDEANISNFVRVAIKDFLEKKDAEKFVARLWFDNCTETLL